MIVRAKCRYKPILVPKLRIAAFYQFLSRLFRRIVVLALQVDRARNVPARVKKIGPIMLHRDIPDGVAYSRSATGNSLYQVRTRQMVPPFRPGCQTPGLGDRQIGGRLDLLRREVG